jgi:hypothetical protein
MLLSLKKFLITNLMYVTSNQYSDAVLNVAKRKIYSDLSLQLTNEMHINWFYICLFIPLQEGVPVVE